MSKNNNSSNIHNSKSTTPEEQNAIRRAVKAKQKHGSKPSSKKSQTPPELRKNFDPATFNVRTDAAALLSNHKEQMCTAFEKFFTKTPDDAFELIWALTYQPKESKPELLKGLGLSSEMVPDLSMLLTELAAQYRAYVDCSFMQAPSLIDELKPAFNAIYSEDPATALFVYNMCTDYLIMNPSENINRALALLSSTEENIFFGGILEVIKVVYMPDKSCRYALSAYLKPRHEKVYNLLKAMADVKAAEEKMNSIVSDSPLANLGKMCTNAGFSLSGNTSHVTQPADQIVSNVKSDSPVSEEPASKLESKVADGSVPTKEFNYSNVADEYELFSSLAKETAKLRSTGIDPATFLKNVETVRKFLELATQLEAAGFSSCQYPDKEIPIHAVLRAEEAKRNANALFNT